MECTTFTPLLRVRKGGDVTISWDGDEECFNKHAKTIANALSDGSLSWEDEADHPPLGLSVDPKFVKLNDECNLRPSVNGDAGKQSHIFLHLYLIHSSSYDEYLQVRSGASEWFARLCEADNPNWLIVFDSSKAKERKIRSSIVDRMKSDFSRYASKLIEVSEPTSITSILSARTENNLHSHIQAAVLASFSHYKSSLTESISQQESALKREGAEAAQVTLLLNTQFRLCRFYWTLGLLEQSLERLDHMDAFVHSLVMRGMSASPPSSPPSSSLSLPIAYGSRVPLLGCAANANSLAVGSENSLVKWRCFILSHYVLANLQLLDRRLRLLEKREASSASLEIGEAKRDPSPSKSKMKPSPSASPTPKGGKRKTEEGKVTEVQLRRDFLSFILRQLVGTFNRLVKELLSVKEADPTLHHLVKLVWFEEVMEICRSKPLAMAELIGGEPIGHMHSVLLSIQCDSLSILASDIAASGLSSARSYVGRLQAPEGSALTPAVAELVEAVSDVKRFQRLAERRLLDALEVFRCRKWRGHVKSVNRALASLYSTASIEDARAKRFDRLVENWRMGVHNLCVRTSPNRCAYSIEAEELASAEFADLLGKDSNLSFDIHLVLSMQRQEDAHWAELRRLIDSAGIGAVTRSNATWGVTGRPVHFPFQLLGISAQFMTATLHLGITLVVNIQSDLPAMLTGGGVEVTAILRRARLGSNHGQAAASPTGPLFEASKTEVNGKTCAALVAISKPADQRRKLTKGDASVSTSASNESPAECIRLSAFCADFQSPIMLEGKAEKADCYSLFTIELKLNEHVSFVIDYPSEAASSPRRLKSVFCLAEVEKPLIDLIADGKPAPKDLKLYSGVVQRIQLRLKYGTATTVARTSELTMRQVASKQKLEFLSPSGGWSIEAAMTIPDHCPSEEHGVGDHLVDVFLFLPIEGMNFSADQQALISQQEIEVEWLGHTWHFRLLFAPIMNLKSSTSILGDRVLFELQVQRGNDPFRIDILPLEAELHQDQSVAKEPVEALLLNPKPLEPIRANSTYQFVWQLPTSKIGRSITITHYIHLKYRMEGRLGGGDGQTTEEASSLLKEISARDYAFDNTLTFAVQKVEYEVVAHVLSDRPQLILCRIELPCDLIVSLRSLTANKESIIVVVEVDQEHWQAVDRFKVVNIKESGVGQTNFTIVPKKVGFLPYPLIYIHRHLNNGQNSERFSLTEASMFGERLTSFHRNQGKQIHVLGHLNASDHETSGSIGGMSTGSSSSAPKKSMQVARSLKSQARDKIHKLFE